MSHKFQRETQNALGNQRARWCLNALACDKHRQLLRRDVSRYTFGAVDPFSLISVIKGGETGNGLVELQSAASVAN